MNLTPGEQLDVSAALAGENEFGWVVEEAICDCCGHEWIAVYPFGIDEIECPDCRYDQPTVDVMPL